jgi:hypothetical protein
MGEDQGEGPCLARVFCARLEILFSAYAGRRNEALAARFSSLNTRIGGGDAPDKQLGENAAQAQGELPIIRQEYVQLV